MHHIIGSLLLILAAQFEWIQLEEAAYALSCLLIFLAVAWYWLLCSTIVGVRSIALNDEIDVQWVFITHIVHALSVWFLISSGFLWSAFFVLPWMLMSLYTDFFAVLISYGFIEIRENEEDDL